ncbi:hypothetical protein BOX15_Mlig004279g2 [Macrostomum lignano]|uniref:Uncharacterized protein n=1 Tax=Macrostomum lignano TaxID=282301 RepID=A0A267ET66_9PLAT|nr:hypothetical protein BOX15_Mlig004279g4 [Macrostomum lignano]PAA89184.1 hypothetical protein BOX15_Mlig004279g2 [Macrostomum lignano]
MASRHILVLGAVAAILASIPFCSLADTEVIPHNAEHATQQALAANQVKKFNGGMFGKRFNGGMFGKRFNGGMFGKRFNGGMFGKRFNGGMFGKRFDGNMHPSFLDYITQNPTQD